MRADHRMKPTQAKPDFRPQAGDFNNISDILDVLI
jgi:hypothetical protein